MRSTMQHDTALGDIMDLGLEALAFILSHEALTERFIALTGLDSADLKARLQDPNLHLALLDFLMNHEPDLMAFCDAYQHSPEAVSALVARHRSDEYSHG